MTRRSELISALGCLLAAGGMVHALASDPLPSAGDLILARVEAETMRRRTLLKDYSVSRQYAMENFRFGKQASVAVLMSYHLAEGERYTVLTRSGSDKLNSIIDRIIESEASSSQPAEYARRRFNPDNYSARLLGNEIAAGRSCYVLQLTPRLKNRFLIVGKIWVDAGSASVVRIEGQFAASMSMLVGTPHITEEYSEVNGFWLPSHLRSITSTLLLGPTELNILFTNYQFDRDAASD